MDGEITEETGTMWQQSPDFLQWQLDPEEIIFALEHYLKGDYYDKKEDKFVNVPSHRMMNDMGVRAVISIVRSKLNKNIILSNLTAEDVRRLAKENRLNIINMIYLKYRDYDIEKHNFDTVVQMVDGLVYATLRRAYNEGERVYLGKTRSSVERITKEDKKGGMLNIPFFGGD